MFSVIIPLYNKSKYIARAIQSAMNQSIQPAEIIVVDDGSTDGGYALVKKLFGNRVKLFTQKNKGVSAARNFAISQASSDFVAFLDADDFWDKGYLELIAKGIQKFPESGIWGTARTSDQNELGKLQGDFYLLTDYFKIFMDKSPFLTSCVVMDKSFFKYQAGFNEKLTRGEDLDVWFRAICFFGNPAFCDAKLVFYEKDDPAALTKKGFLLERSLLSVISFPEYDYQITFKNQVIRKHYLHFKAQFFRMHIPKYFNSDKNREIISRSFSSIHPQMALIDNFYKLPFPFLKWFFSSRRRVKYFKSYLNFCFKNFYK